MSVKMSEMTADSSVAGTEKILVLDDTTSKTMTVDVLSAYVIDDLVDSTAATPTSGDLLLGARGTDEKTLTLNLVSSYAVDYVFGAASEADPAVTGDMLLIERSNVMYQLDVDTLVTYALTGIQATVLNTSALGSATLDATDLFPVCETGTPTVPKTATLAALETKLWVDFATYAGALDVVGTAADGDKLYVLQSGTPKHITLTLLSDYVVDEILAGNDLTTDVLAYLPTYIATLDAATLSSTDVFYLYQTATGKSTTLDDITNYIVNEVVEQPWTAISESKYETAPLSTSTITMTDTSDVAVGYPLRYQIGGLTYYGIATAVNANALLTVAGASLSGTLQNLYVGKPERVVQKHFYIDTVCCDAAQDILSTITYERFRWDMANSYLVTFTATLGVVDTGAEQPYLNVKIGSSLVSTENTNAGPQLSDTEGTWTANSAVEISTTAYDISRGTAVDIRCTTAGTNGDADCLSVDLTFVLE